jgi:hypothetical protein
MTPEVIAALLLGVPLAIMCGGVIMHMMLMIAILALLMYAPFLGVSVLALWGLWRIVPFFFAGLGIGLGIGKRP